jgi:prepilin-type N-terminal cleavage/methylation domain-containing protein
MKALSTSIRSSARRGFTLLEVVLAVMILGMTALAIHQFVRGTLRALSYSVEDTEEQLAVERLVQLVQEGLYGISPRGQATLLGDNLKLNNRNLDSMEWRSRGGAGLMTTAATGEYRVQLRIMPLKNQSSKYEIGLWRRPALLDTAGGLVAGGSDKDADWVPLLQNVDGMMIRYWDARLNQPVDKWVDQAARPSFVMLSIWRGGDPMPYEAVLTVPAALSQQ